jgi:hypothetical protein
MRMSGKLLPLDLKPADFDIFFILFMNIHEMNIQYIIFNPYYIKLFKTQEHNVPISEDLLLLLFRVRVQFFKKFSLALFKKIHNNKISNQVLCDQ